MPTAFRPSSPHLHPLLQTAIDDACHSRQPILVRLPEPGAPADPWAFAQGALISGEDATLWAGPEDDTVAVGVGEALRWVGRGAGRLAQLEAQRRALDCRAPSDIGELPLWFGGFSFDHGIEGQSEDRGVWAGWPAAELLTHAITAISHRGRRVLVLSLLVVPDDAPQAVHARWFRLRKLAKRLQRPASPSIRSTLRFEHLEDRVAWGEQIAGIQQAIAADTLHKLVLARRVRAPWRESLNSSQLGTRVGSALQRLHAAYPHCTNFALLRHHEGAPSVFFGSTPELLIEQRAGMLQTMALAGTVRRGTTPAQDECAIASLLRSSKDREEHAFVVRDIVESLQSMGAEVVMDDAPNVVSYPNVHHLRTVIRAKASEPRGLLATASVLHPTPAICGTPTQRSYRWLREHEHMHRGWYAGGVGWINDAGDGRINVALRAAIADAHAAVAYAGAGIVKDSDPGEEWDETNAKLSPIQDAFFAREDARHPEP